MFRVYYPFTKIVEFSHVGQVVPEMVNIQLIPAGQTTLIHLSETVTRTVTCNRGPGWINRQPAGIADRTAFAYLQRTLIRRRCFEDWTAQDGTSFGSLKILQKKAMLMEEESIELSLRSDKSRRNTLASGADAADIRYVIHRSSRA